MNIEDAKLKRLMCPRAPIALTSPIASIRTRRNAFHSTHPITRTTRFAARRLREALTSSWLVDLIGVCTILFTFNLCRREESMSASISISLNRGWDHRCSYVAGCSFIIPEYRSSTSVMFAILAFCSQVARLPGQAGAAASSTVYKKPNMQKMTKITVDDHLYPLFMSHSYLDSIPLK